MGVLAVSLQSLVAQGNAYCLTGLANSAVPRAVGDGATRAAVAAPVFWLLSASAHRDRSEVCGIKG